MKIWKSFAGEHSANLKIIGTFKTEDDAQKAATFYNELIDVQDKTKGTNQYFSDELMELFNKYDFMNFTSSDAEQADYFYKFSADGNKIEVTTDELEIQSIIKVFIFWGAKIKVFSRHNDE